jgi:RNA polymerase sigma-70 factor (ECF subfamily)
VLAVVYLIFNEGYSATSGSDLLRVRMCEDAIRIGRCLNEQFPMEPEAKGLLSLMLLHHARRNGRTDEHGDLVPLENQNRSLWDQAQIGEGAALVEQALSGHRPGKYALQGAIAAVHALAASAGETDWSQIASPYDRLVLVDSTPVVHLNRAIAIAMSRGFEEGLAQLETIELPGYHLLPAARADLLRRLGRRQEAAASYRQAFALVSNEAERRFLARRLAEHSACSAH